MKFLKNAWYVGALSQEVTTAPIQKIVLGEKLVIYRTESGQAAALGDVCPHRFAPLHKGKVKGDCIECPYHGLQFNAQGACSLNPHGDHEIPRAAKVRSYPVVERDGIVWTWAGNPEEADESKVLDLHEFFGEGRLPVVGGSFEIRAHVGLVLDNLMDLSHAPFLHPTTLAEPSQVETLRLEVKQEGDSVWAYHYIPSSIVSNQFRPFWRSTAPLCDARAHMRWDPPCNLQLDVGTTECGRPESEGIYIHMAHLLTPIDEGRTSYFWLASRNYETDNAEVSARMCALVNQAFSTEDEPMLCAVAENMGSVSDVLSLNPALLPGDAAAVRVRRILQKLLDESGRSAQIVA